MYFRHTESDRAAAQRHNSNLKANAAERMKKVAAKKKHKKAS